MKFSRAEIERCIKYGDITSNGVVFHWELPGPDGAHFFLIKDRRIMDYLPDGQGGTLANLKRRYGKCT